MRFVCNQVSWIELSARVARQWGLSAALALSMSGLAHADQHPTEASDSLRDLPRLVTSVTVQQAEFEKVLSEYVRWGGETSHLQVKEAFAQFRSRATELSLMVGHTELLFTQYRDLLVVDDGHEVARVPHAERRSGGDAIQEDTENPVLASFERTKRLLGWWNGRAKIAIARVGLNVDTLEEGDAILHHSMRRQLDSLGDSLFALQLSAFERQGHIDLAFERRDQRRARQIQITYIALAVAMVLVLVMLGFFLRQKARDGVALLATNELLQGKVEEASRLAAQLEFTAMHDQLTELHNRHSFSAALDRTFTDSAASHAIVFIDLDKFKTVNDTCGHAAGDVLLQRISKVLSGQAEGRGIAARFGGDEFVLLLPRCGLGTLRGVAHSTCQLMSQIDFRHDDQQFPVGGSIGAVLFESSCTTPAMLMQAVDEACYEAKNQGGGCAVLRDIRSASVDTEPASIVKPIKKAA